MRKTLSNSDKYERARLLHSAGVFSHPVLQVVRLGESRLFLYTVDCIGNAEE